MPGSPTRAIDRLERHAAPPPPNCPTRLFCLTNGCCGLCLAENDVDQDAEEPRRLAMLIVKLLNRAEEEERWHP